jgi:hypothetical protein
MAAEFTGKITFNPDCKPSEPQHKIKCAALEISKEGSGNLNDMVDDLTEEIRDKVSTEFRTTPRSVAIIGYSVSVKYSVVGPVNRSLAEFSGEYSATIVLSDGTEMDIDKLKRNADQVIAYANKTGKTVDEVLAEAKAELARRKRSGQQGAPAS